MLYNKGTNRKISAIGIVWILANQGKKDPERFGKAVRYVIFFVKQNVFYSLVHEAKPAAL